VRVGLRVEQIVDRDDIERVTMLAQDVLERLTPDPTSGGESGLIQDRISVISGKSQNFLRSRIEKAWSSA
jgi:hypothetical protein